MFAVYDFDRFSKHDQIGEVKIPLNQIDLVRSESEISVSPLPCSVSGAND